MKIILVCGTRPNFVKIAPLIRAIEMHNVHSPNNSIEPFLVHTGQHYDYEMSRSFFVDLRLPEPDYHLGIGSGMHAEQTGMMMVELEKIFVNRAPDLVVVVGDVNSTLAAAIAAAKLNIPLAHVEAGLRSYDRTMPEEINRLLTDAVSDYLFTPSEDADENLRKEGVSEEKIFLVGNVMADSLLRNMEIAARSDILTRLGLQSELYAVLTLHRPENVDQEQSLASIFTAMAEISKRIPIIFPCHPRTRKAIAQFGLTNLVTFIDNDELLTTSGNAVFVTNPLNYLDFMQLMMNAKFVLTDSGGVQEETTMLNIPCLTLRNSTERPITVSQGTSLLVGTDTDKTVSEAFKILNHGGKVASKLKYWDGKAAERIIETLARII